MPRPAYSLSPDEPSPGVTAVPPPLVPGTFWFLLTPPMHRVLRTTNRAPLGYALLSVLASAVLIRLLLMPPAWVPRRWVGRGLRPGEGGYEFLVTLIRDPRRTPLLAYVAIIAVVAVFIAVAAWVRQGWQARQDRTGGTFERHVGYIKVLPIWRGSEMEVGPERLRVPSRGRGWMVRTLDWAVVDYAVHRGLVFEVRDREDRIVYRHAAYHPELGARVVPPAEG